MHTIGGRLKVWRESRLLKQADAAAALSLSGSTYQNYERDVRAPNTEGWEAFVRAGINANWLLTGDGPMLLADLVAPTPAVAPPAAPPKINVDALEAIIEGTIKALPKASPDAIARQAVSFYVQCIEKELITPEGIGSSKLNVAA